MTATWIRRAALVSTAVALPLLAAAPASADVPEGWSKPDEVGLVEVLLVVAVLPIALGLLIVLAVYLPAMTRGERVAPGAETPDEWFGGPDRAVGELEPASGPTSTTGGASGSW